MIEPQAHHVVMTTHMLLANLGSDAYVFNVDVDEFLVTDNRTTLADLFGCFGNRSAIVPRCGLCS